MANILALDEKTDRTAVLLKHDCLTYKKGDYRVSEWGGYMHSTKRRRNHRDLEKRFSERGLASRLSLSQLSLSISLLLLCAFALALQMNLSNPYLSNYDEGVYLSSARLVTEGYPLFTSVFSSQPPAFLEILALAFRLFGDTLTVGRGVMVFFSLVSLGSVAWISWRLIGPLASPLAIVSLGLPLVFFQQSRRVLAENPALAFSLLAVALILPGTKQLSSKRVIAGGVLFALGMLCKLLVAPMILPILFLLALEPVSDTSTVWRFSTAKPVWVFSIVRRYLIFALASMTTFLLALSMYDYSAAYDQVVRFHIEAKGYFVSDMASNLQDIYERVLKRELGVMFLAVAGLTMLFARNPLAAAWICLWVLAVSLFLFDHSPLHVHHLILLLPPLAIAAAASVLWILAYWHKGWGKLLPVFLVWLFICYDSTSGFLDWSVQRDLAVSLKNDEPRQEQKVLSLVQTETDPGDFVVSDELMHAFAADRQPPPMLVDNSLLRIKSGFLTDEQAINSSRDARMVIFWTHRLTLLPQYRQWV